LYSEKWAKPVLSMRHEGDVLADALIDRIYKEGALDAVNKTLEKLVRNDGIPTSDLHPEVTVFLEQTCELPAWADREKMKRASAIFDIHGLQMVMMLFGAALPTLYAARKGAQVLVLTNRMVDYTFLKRRIMETAQFMMDVTEYDAFEPDGQGVVAVQKVRLIHAAIRCCILNDPTWNAHWDMDWGVPINQVDLAGTMLSFSTTVLQAMANSSIALSAEEKEAYLHHWKVIGHILGIKEIFMPVDYADSIDQMDTTLKLNHEPSEAGKILANALVEFLHEHIPFFKSYITDTIRYWIGRHAAHCLSLPGYRWTIAVFQLQRVVWWVESHLQIEFPLIGRLSRTLNRRMLLAIIQIERGQRTPFRLPSTLRDDLDFN
jgi:hypothetical protein